MRQRFDPREHLKAVEVRATAAADTAARFSEDFSAGKLDPSLPAFHQGNLDGETTAVPGELSTEMDVVLEAGAESAAAVAANGNVRFLSVSCCVPGTSTSSSTLGRALAANGYEFVV